MARLGVRRRLPTTPGIPYRLRPSLRRRRFDNRAKPCLGLPSSRVPFVQLDQIPGLPESLKNSPPLAFCSPDQQVLLIRRRLVTRARARSPLPDDSQRALCRVGSAEMSGTQSFCGRTDNRLAVRQNPPGPAAFDRIRHNGFQHSSSSAPRSLHSRWSLIHESHRDNVQIHCQMGLPNDRIGRHVSASVPLDH